MPGFGGQLFPPQKPKIAIPSFRFIRVYGHSGAAGTGLPNGAGKYSSRLAAQLHATESNLAVAGAVASHHDGNGFSRPYGNSSPNRTVYPYMSPENLVFLNFGNDQTYNTEVDPFRAAMNCLICRVSAGRIWENTAITFESGWSASANEPTKYSGGTMHYTFTQGRKGTMTVPADLKGSAEVDLFTAFDGTVANASWNVIKNGSVIGTLNTNDSLNGLASGKVNGQVYRVPNCVAGDVVGFEAGAAGAIFDYATLFSVAPPTIILMGYVQAPEGTPNAMTEGTRVAYDNVLRQLATQYPNTFYFDANAHLKADPRYFFADGHPNDLGHSVVAAGVMDLLGSVVSPLMTVAGGV